MPDDVTRLWRNWKWSDGTWGRLGLELVRWKAIKLPELQEAQIAGKMGTARTAVDIGIPPLPVPVPLKAS